VLNADWWKRQLFLRRSLFHSLAGLRFLCEIPRWRVAESGENAVSFSDCVIGSLVCSIADGRCKCCNHCHVFATRTALWRIHIQLSFP
jgi:hypothetical protein